MQNVPYKLAKTCIAFPAILWRELDISPHGPVNADVSPLGHFTRPDVPPAFRVPRTFPP